MAEEKNINESPDIEYTPEEQALKKEKHENAEAEAATEAADVVHEDTGEDSIEKLREKLKIAVKEKQEYLDGWQRAKAEYINTRKRDQEANEQYLKFAKEEVITQLIPVLDSFEMAFANKETWEKIDTNWRKGIEHIYSQLLSVLTANNVVQIDPLGQKFDPGRDEAVEYEPVNEDRYDQTITKVISKGYKLNNRLIKPVKVRVGMFKKQ